MESYDESRFCRTAVSMYQYELSAAFSKKQSAENAHRSYASLTGLVASAPAPEDACRSTAFFRYSALPVVWRAFKVDASRV